MTRVDSIVAAVSAVSIDGDFMRQEELDLRNRDRTSLYPWRGQFSPGLIESLLRAYSSPGSFILDPFVGSGTTLFESARMNLPCYGAEIHPAAIAFSRMARFCNLTSLDRRNVCSRAEMFLEKHLAGHLPTNLFRLDLGPSPTLNAETVQGLLEDVSSDQFVSDFVISTLLLAMGDSNFLAEEALDSAFKRNYRNVMQLPFTSEGCNVLMSDARDLQLPPSSVDLVLTSPPYINVFNYHHNYRALLEMMGWRMLDVAPSELGANRKHRANRFLTVIQFSMDLVQAFLEIRRVLRPDGSAVCVIGRESRVRGVPFNNGMLLALSATGGAGFELQRWQERRFTNRFGTSIFEEIMTFEPDGSVADDPVSFGREVGIWGLRSRLDSAEGEIREYMMQAIERAPDVNPSPPFALQISH